MPTDFEHEYKNYLARFDRLVGPYLQGQYGRFRNRLVVKLAEAEFRGRVEHYMVLGDRFTQRMSTGDTIDDTLVAELRAVEVDLVLEQSLFLPNLPRPSAARLSAGTAPGRDRTAATPRG
jgi:hypothetical protein